MLRVSALATARRRLAIARKRLRPIALAEKQDEQACFTFELFDRSLYAGGFQSGETKLRNIWRDLDRVFPDGKYDLQTKIHSQTLRACLRQILGHDYNSCVQRVCQQYGWDGPKQNVIFVASRRGGKSTGMASVAAALLVHIPNLKIVNFSGGEDSAEEFCQMIGDYAERMGSGKRVKVTKKKTTVFHSSTSESHVTAYPSGGRSYDVSSVFLFFHKIISHKTGHDGANRV